MTGSNVIDVRGSERTFTRPVDQRHSFTLQRLNAFMIEVEDVHFNFDSAVLLPDFRQTEHPDDDDPEHDAGDHTQRHITALAVIAAVYKQAGDNPEQKMLLTGHTDRSGPDAYNLRLSELRAGNVLALMKGDREAWRDIADGKHQVEDYQQILTFLHEEWGFDCDPGGITNRNNADTRAALERFQIRYNAEVPNEEHFETTIEEDGRIGPETWGAFFDVYMVELSEILDTDKAGLFEKQVSLTFLGPDFEAVGCGENFPKTAENRSRTDRRVEILFFDPGEEPTHDPEMTCHKTDGRCVHERCQVNNRRLFRITLIPVEPVLPRRFRCRVHLKIGWNDPAGVLRGFPKDHEVTVKFNDAVKITTTVGERGVLDFIVDRRKESFQLALDFEPNSFLASPGAAEADPKEKVIPESEVRAHTGADGRVWKVPESLTFNNADWEVQDAAANGFSDRAFRDFSDAATREEIGSHATPLEVKLDPHWQFVKVLYWDRKVKKQLSIPAIPLEGFADKDATGDGVTTLSNWTTTPEACQCLPWVIRRSEDTATETPKPDNKVLLQFRTAGAPNEPGTFIDSTGADNAGAGRKIVSRGGGGSASTTDPGLTVGENASIDLDEPSGKRVAHYDLPKVWKSRTWFARLSGGTGNPPTKQMVFEDLAGDATANDKPVLFSLDDMVLTNNSLEPEDWKADAAVLNRIAIYSGLFQDDGPSKADLTSSGHYKPDGMAFQSGTDLAGDPAAVEKKFHPTNKQSYFTQRPTASGTFQPITDRNYIHEYPCWPRLVARGGHMYSAFDMRTPDEDGQVVGARAAVRLFDIFASESHFVEPGERRPRTPSAVTGKYMTVQPLFEQNHRTFGHIGRFDLIRLRCCGVDTDGETEIGACLSYVRFFHDLNASDPDGGRNNPNAIGSGLTGADAKDWPDTAIRNIVQRWNGPHRSKRVVLSNGRVVKSFLMNPGPGIIVATTPGVKHKSRVIWIAQELPRNRAHFEIQVLKNPPPEDGGDPKTIRAFMRASTGFGISGIPGKEEKIGGAFTAAHETGHGASLVDEYIEHTTPFGELKKGAASLPSFDNNSPGSPWCDDNAAMMRTNRVVRPRHHWHCAEWFRQLESDNIDFRIDHHRHQYKIPHIANLAPRRNHVGWPLNEEKDIELGDHGRFNAFFYPLGKEHYSVFVLPGRARADSKAPRPAPFDGLITVPVKIEYEFDIEDKQDMHDFLNKLNINIRARFNHKILARGRFDGVDYARVLINFQPRFFSDEYSVKDPNDDDEHIFVEVRESGGAEWDSGIFSSDHKLFFPRATTEAFPKFFANMIGIGADTGASKADIDDPANYTAIARKVIPGATCFSV